MEPLLGAEALTYNGSAWSPATEIPRAPDRGGMDVSAVSCSSSAFCMAAAEFEGAAALYENGAWSPWDPIEINGAFSSVSCPAASFCIVVNDAGQAFTYGTAGMTQGGGGTTTAATAPTALSPPMFGPPIEKRKPAVNGKTG